MRAAVETEAGVVVVDLDEEEVVGDWGRIDTPPAVDVPLPLVIAADRSGATIVVVVDRRPPLAISRDAGSTWKEAGSGLPPGRAVAISPEHPDLILYATESRLHLSRDGGRFWRALAPELPGIVAVAWLG